MSLEVDQKEERVQEAEASTISLGQDLKRRSLAGTARKKDISKKTVSPERERWRMRKMEKQR